MQRTHNTNGKSLNFSLFLFIAVLIFTPFASAELTDGLVSYYDFDTNYSDILGVNDLSIASGSPNSVTGKLGNAYNFVAGSSECFAVTPTGFNVQDTTISFWVNFDVSQSNNNPVHYGDVGSNNLEGYRFTTQTTNKIDFQLMETSSTSTTALANSNSGTGSWIHVVGVINDSADTGYLWVDGTKQTDTGAITSNLYGSDDFKVGCARSTTALVAFFDGQVDEIGVWNRSLTDDEIADLYNSGTGLPYENFTSAPATPVATERVQQDSYLEQTGTTTINSISYVPVLSGDVEILYNTSLYGSTTIPLTASASNTAICHISIDGAELGNSETTRSLTAGQSGNVLVTSQEESVTPGNYTFAVECKRSGGGSFEVENATMYLHILSTQDGLEIEATENNITSSAISGTFGTFYINTTENATDTGYTRALVLEWTAEYDYTATENMSVTPVLAGTNCTPVIRYGSSGSRGNVAGVCYRSGLTNETEYNATFIGSGSGNIENAVFHLKEFVLHTQEINGTELDGILVNSSSFVNISNHTVSIDVGHTTPDFVSEVVISVLSNNGTTTPSFYLTDGTTNTDIVQRSVGTGEPGVLGIQGHFPTLTGTNVFYLVGKCPNQDCSLTGVEFVSYMTNELAIEPNSFFITVNNTYTGSSINDFDVLIDNTTFSTTTGTIEAVTEEALVNITHPATNTSSIPFFENTTINHNTNNNLTIQAIPWTAIYALEPDALTSVNNYTITWNKQNGTGSGTVSTTSGTAYVPLFNGTYDVNISSAVGDDGTNYAIQSQVLNASNYLENYTFNLLVSNSVNITFFDEETGLAIVGTDIDLEYFSSSGTSGNETTNTSVMFINLLLPETYTFIYDAPGYDQRFYEFTLINETFNNLNLTLLNSTSSSTVTITVKDTLNNPVENAKVKILKFDVSDNEFDLIEVRETNFEGQTIAGMILNNPLYKFIIEKEGTVVLSTEGTQIYGTSLTLVVDLIQNTGFEEILTSYKMSGAITYDNSSYEFTFDYNDESNTGTQACLTIYRWSDVKTVYNQSCSATTTGTLTATVANVTGRTYQAIGTIVDSNSVSHVIDTDIIRFAERIQDNGSSLVMMILMIIVFVTALAVSVEIAIVGAFAVPLMFNVIGLTTLNMSISVTLLVTGIVIAFIIGVIKR